MHADIHLPEIVAYLARDTLKHIVHLKAFSAYSEHIISKYFSDGLSAGVLFIYPTKATTYESVRYPGTEYVVLLASDAPSVTEQMLAHLPADCEFVIKLMSSKDKTVVEQDFSLTRVTSFLSFTQPAGSNFPAPKRVVIAKELDDRLLPFYRANGYERDEVERYFRAGSAFYCAIYENGEPVAACMAFENYGSIWEIAGLYTIERTRRQGLARDVVTTALSTLIKNGYIPRYQMDEGNIASKQLALDLGLSLFLTTEHFIGVKRSDKYRSHSRHRV